MTIPCSPVSKDARVGTPLRGVRRAWIALARPFGCHAVRTAWKVVPTFAVACAIGVTLASSSAIFAADKPPEKVTYEEHIKPLMRNSCLNCHNPEKHKAGLDMTTYQGLMQGSDNGKVIIPGDAEKSLLYRVCTYAEEPKMPPKSDKLADAELALIRKFIEIGALENAGSKAVAMKGAAPAVVASDEKAPDGPPPMPKDFLLEPSVRVARAGQIAALAASRWAPLVAVAGQKQVLLYNTDTLELAGVLPFPEGFPCVLKFSRNCQLLLAGGGVGASYGRVVVWDVVTGDRVLEAGDETDAVLAADISPDHSRVVLGGPSKWLKVFSGKDGSAIKQIKKHTDWVTAIAFSPDGKYLVSGDRSGNAYVWDTNVRALWALTGHKGPITAISCAGSVAATASEDGTVKLWNLKEGSQIKSWTAHNGGVSSVEFTRDGKLVTCGRDKLAKLWDQNGGTLKSFEEFPDVALRATFTSGKVIAGDWTGLVRVWNAEDAKRAGELSANPPLLAERIDATTKQLAELQPAKEKFATELAAAENAAKQVAAELEAAKNAAAQTEARMRENDAKIAGAKKIAGAAAVALQQAQAALETKQVTPSRTKFEQAKTVADAAATELTRLEKSTGEQRDRAKQLADAAAGAAASAAKNIADKALADAATQSKDAATKAVADADAAQKISDAKAAESKPLADAAAKAAEELKQATAAREAATVAVSTQTAAVEKAHAGEKAVEDAVAKAKAEFEAAKQAVTAKTAQSQQAADVLAKVKQASAQTGAQFAAAKAGLGRWKAAQINTALHAARAELAKIEPEFNRAAEADKAAVAAVEKARADVAEAGRVLSSAPEKIKALEKSLLGTDTAAGETLSKLNAEVQSAPAKLHQLRAAEQMAIAQAATTRAEAAKILVSAQPRIAATRAKVEKLKNEYAAARD